MAYFKSKIRVLAGVILFLALFAWSPNLASAADVYLSADYPSISVGDSVIVSLMMDPLGKIPNVVEGDVLLKGGSQNIKISELSTAGSVLTYWPRNPSLDNSNLKISFIGGKPNGFNKTGVLFKIVFLAKTEGKVTFLPANLIAYDNDGKATPIEISVSPLTINIGPKGDAQPKDQWFEIISKDNQSPQQLSAIVGQDNAIFDGKKFITISAIDDQSGIDYYEVKEGDWPTVRTGESYVLQDQKELSTIIITAHDKAGNYSRILLRPAGQGVNYWRLIIILIIILVVFYSLFVIFKKIRRKNA